MRGGRGGSPLWSSGWDSVVGAVAGAGISSADDWWFVPFAVRALIISSTVSIGSISAVVAIPVAISLLVACGFPMTATMIIFAHA